jgi:isopenicillin N synthase-like dioxygenase
MLESILKQDASHRNNRSKRSTYFINSLPKNMVVEATKAANLASVSLAGLLAGEADAVGDLVSSCKENGFFYLDFRHPSTCDTLKHVEELATIGKSVFKLPLEEKEEYSTEKYLPSRLLGYVFVSSSFALY